MNRCDAPKARINNTNMANFVQKIKSTTPIVFVMSIAMLKNLKILVYIPVCDALKICLPLKSMEFKYSSARFLLEASWHQELDCIPHIL